MHRFTAEFGMGSGGSNALWSSRNSGTDSFSRTLQQIGYVIKVQLVRSQTFVFMRLHTPQSAVFVQIAWVLYGQASRAISIG